MRWAMVTPEEIQAAGEWSVAAVERLRAARLVGLPSPVPVEITQETLDVIQRYHAKVAHTAAIPAYPPPEGYRAAKVTRIWPDTVHIERSLRYRGADPVFDRSWLVEIAVSGQRVRHDGSLSETRRAVRTWLISGDDPFPEDLPEYVAVPLRAMVGKDE